MSEQVYVFKKFEEIDEVSIDRIERCHVLCMPKHKILNYFSTSDNRPIVYFLFNEYDRQVYVGQTSNPLNRFKNHINQKTWWDEVIILSSKLFTDSIIRYLESHFISLSKGNLLFKFNNQQNSPYPTVSYSDKIICQMIIEEVLKIFELRRFQFYRQIDFPELDHNSEINAEQQIEIRSNKHAKIIIQPCGKVARKNFENTILTKVDLSSKNMGLTPVWGVHKEKYFDSLSEGDHYYFGNDSMGLFHYGEICKKFIDQSLALSLWNDISYKYIFTLKNTKNVNISLTEFNIGIGYKENAPIQAFKVLNDEREKMFKHNFENQ